LGTEKQGQAVEKVPLKPPVISMLFRAGQRVVKVFIPFTPKSALLISTFQPKGEPMNNENSVQNTPVNIIPMPSIPAQEDAPALVKKIGKTTYRVRVHFSATSNETMSDKIKRMLRNEVNRM
jgi:hypothetical protein